MKSCIRIVGSVFISMVITVGTVVAAGIEDYCITPAFIQTPILPNLLLLIDNSASQYDLTYTGASECYDASYDNSKTLTAPYEGYFPYPVGTNPADLTTYEKKIGDWKYKYDLDPTSSTYNMFVKVTDFPTATTATYDTPYLYIHMSGTGATRYVDAFYATGNFLNWLTMSKLDIQKKVLTGGKWVSGTSPYLLAQSRGCNGMRFIKSIPVADWIHKIVNSDGAVTLNITVRGPAASENYDASNPNNMISPSTLGGQTKIEIYESAYNYTACNTAITSWQQQILGNGVGSVATDVQACLGTSGSGNTTAGRENSNYVEWVRNTIQIAQNIKNGLTTYDPANPNAGILKNVTPSNFAGNCRSVYTSDCAGSGVVNNNGTSATNQTAIESCATLNNPLGGNYICSRKSNLLNAPVPFPYNAADFTAPDASLLNDGYAGSCWSGDTQGNAFDSFKPTGDPDCLARQILHFSASSAASNVIDPSGGSAATPTSGGLPGILAEAGLRSGGEPLRVGSATGSRTMQANVHMASQPLDGIIQRYDGSMRLGVMTFNYDGSASECYDPVTGTPAALSTSQVICGRYCLNTVTPASSSQKACKANADCLTGETCTLTPSPKTDGSKILSGAYIGDPIGDHNSGIIQAIDNINATSWTPFAEAMYNAIGYFARDANTGNSRWQLQADDFSLTKNPQQLPCRPNNLLLITDGMSTADQNSTVNNVAAWAQTASGLNAGQTGFDATNKCPIYSGARNFDDMVWLAKNKNINTLNLGSSAALAASPAPGVGSSHNGEFINTYIVFTGVDQASMQGQCNPKTLLAAAASNGGSTLFEATQPSVFKAQLDEAFAQIAGGVSSGTAASILSNSEGSGANLLQAVFYPKKVFENSTEVGWTGEMQNMWYYVDPFIANSTVREDTDFSTTTPNHILNLKNDYAVRFYFEDGETKVERKQDTDGDGLGNSPAIDTGVSPDNVKSLWRAGRQLWARSADTRTIHTSIDGYTLLPSVVSGKGGFYTTHTAADTAAATAADARATTLQPYLQASSTDSNLEAVKIINYVRGTDQAGYRPRMASLLVGGAPVTREWKLGDIISSTPRLQSTNKLNTYDLAAPAGYSDKSYGRFIKLPNYQNRGMAYVGANDGMLHAFKLGKLTVAAGADTGIPSGTGTSTVKIGGFVKASLTGTNLGEEQWTYIPRSALPYLKYYTDKDNYRHIYYLDGPTVLSDISVAKTGTCATDYSLCLRDNVNGSNWRSVLIGSMGLGGATKLSTNGCTTDVNGTCVKTPVFDPEDTAVTKTRGLGYSSYFALDVTDQYFNTDGTLAHQPTLKWEFPPRDVGDNFGLGYATSGAAIIRIAAKKTIGGVIKPDTAANGKWFAVFASGPTGPIASNSQRFLGRSDQNLKLFVVDLGATINATTPFVLNTNYWVIDTGITNAFGGSVVSGGIDTDRWNGTLEGNYQDDVLYVGYTKKRTDSTGEVTWTDGGVGRLLTKESTNPSEWVFSKVIDGIGPVTTGIAKLQDRNNKKLWLYFGTGRFYYGEDDSQSTQSAANNQRYLMGVQEQCYTNANRIDPACDTSTALVLSDLKNQTLDIAADLGTKKGWYVELDGKNTTDKLSAERSITDAVALTNGGVFFTTFKPTTDDCKFGGYSYIWGFNYATGGAAAASALKGKVLIQVSTGAFEEVSLSTALTAEGDRKMGTPMIGKPPVDAPPIISSAANKPVKKILHIQEK